MRNFKENAVQTGCSSIIKDVVKYASDLIVLILKHPIPRAMKGDGGE